METKRILKKDPTLVFPLLLGTTGWSTLKTTIALAFYNHEYQTLFE